MPSSARALRHGGSGRYRDGVRTPDGVVIAAGDRRFAARTVFGDRAIDAAIELDLYGNTAHIVDSTGVAAVRMERDAATRAFSPIDVIEVRRSPLAPSRDGTSRIEASAAGD